MSVHDAGADGEHPSSKAGRSSTQTEPSLSEALAALEELVRLKDIKDRLGETPDYRASKDQAWTEARRLVVRGQAMSERS